MHTIKAALSGLVLIGTVATSGFSHWVADPAAVVVQVSGSVQIQAGGQGATKAATVGASLNAGDKLIIGTGAKAVLLHKTGRTQIASATLTVPQAETQQAQGLFKQAVNTMQQVATTNARAQPNRQGMIRPIQGEPIPISPRNGVKVLDVRPAFTWFSVPGATGYTIQIRRITPAGGTIQRFQVGKDTAWSYPLSAGVLIPGAEYEWTVGAEGGRIASKRERFRIVSGEEFMVVANTLRELATAGIDPMTDGLFVTALAYRDAGAYYEANRLLDLLSGTGTRGRVFFMLRGEVLDAIGDVDGASRAFSAADSEPGTE